MFKRLLSILALTATGANFLSAATWYVDNTAGGSQNGTSWTNAWTNLSSISGVKPGDTVYISGGPSGSSQTYPTGTWAPSGGSSGSPITYQIGQDSAHDGKAIFSGSGTFLKPSSYLAIVGDAGDGQMHFSAIGDSTIIWWQGGTLSGVRLGYINFGQVGSNGSTPEDVLYLNAINGFEFDHNYIYLTSPTANSFAYMVTTDAAFDGTKIHDNEIHLPENYGAGADCFEAGGSSGYSIYNNKMIAYALPNYYGGQHIDGWQDTGGSSYIKLYNNYVQSFGNSCFFADGYYGGFTHLWIYNNVGVMTSPVVPGWYPEGCTVRPDGDSGTKVFTDVRVMNNIFVDLQTEFAVAMGANIYGSGYSATFNNCAIQNNISINTGVGSPTGAFAYDPSVSTADNVAFNLSADNGDFVKYVQYGATSDFHLLSAATSLIGQGVNESAYFTTDHDGNLRPASGAWDIGPYEYGSSPSPPSLSVSSITDNALDVDPNTVGVQVYEGTIVTYSTTAIETSTNIVSWEWSYAVNGGPSVAYQSGTGVVSSVQFDYATGAGGSTYVWTLLANDGKTNASASIATSVETPPSTNMSLSFQVTSGSITAPLTVTSNYISQPVRTTVISNAGEASFNFTITNAGNYVVQALVNAPNDGANSFYVSIDAQPVDPIMCWDIPATTNFVERLVSWRGNGSETDDEYVPKIFNLAIGVHQIIFAGRDPNTQLESFSILALPAAPQNVRVLPTMTGSVLNFNAGP